MKLLLLLSSLILSHTIAIAQVDSLKKLLYQQKLNDKDKAMVYLEIANHYWNTQLDSCERYINKTLTFSNKEGSEEILAKALLQKANLLKHYAENQESQKVLRKARSIIEKNNFQKLMPLLYSTIGKSFRANPDSSLAYYNKSLSLAKDLALPKDIIDTKLKIAIILLHQKKHAELSELLHKIIPEVEKNQDYDNLMTTYTYMSLVFRDLNDKEKSLMYANKAINLVDKSKDKKQQAFILGAIGGGVTGYFEDLDKSEPLVKRSLALAVEINDKALIKTSNKRLAILYYNNSEYKKSNEIINRLLAESTDPDVIKTKGLLLSEEKQYTEANKYFDKAYKLYEKDGAYVQQKMILLSKIDNKLAINQDKELTETFLTLDSLNEIIHNRESKNQFFDLETKYRTAEKEAEIQKKELALAESRSKIIMISSISAIVILISLFIIWYLRNKEKRKELEHQNNVLVLQSLLNSKELESINNQLNPHEIKNLITSIAPELLTKAPESYKKLIKLFNVTRSSLSDNLTESLDIQLNQIQDYLELQQSISPYKWDFQINDNTDIEPMQLPRLILKNMVENAVKYGIKNNKDEGMIVVDISSDSRNLTIAVRDNGISDLKTPNPESTGIGLSAYTKLFQILNAKNERKAYIQLERKKSWTCANIIIPLNYTYQ